MAEVRDDPYGRLALAEEAYLFGTGSAVEYFSRAELAFIRWEIRRGVLNSPDSSGGQRRGSRWWRTINEGLLRDCEEASLMHREGLASGGSSLAVNHWLAFFISPSPEAWYRAHNASVVCGYLDGSELAVHESRAEQILMSVILTRALYAYMLATRHARLGPLARIGQWLANPSGEGIVAVIDFPEFYPPTYPMSRDAARRLLGIGLSPQALAGRISNLVISWDIQRVFSWNAERLGIPDLMTLIRNGSPSYPPGRSVSEVTGGFAVHRRLTNAYAAP